MDLNLIVAIAVAVLVTWTLLLVLFWVLRPKGVPVREVIGVIPDLLRLLRSLISDRAVTIDVRVVSVRSMT